MIEYYGFVYFIDTGLVKHLRMVRGSDYITRLVCDDETLNRGALKYFYSRCELLDGYGFDWSTYGDPMYRNFLKEAVLDKI